MSPGEPGFDCIICGNKHHNPSPVIRQVTEEDVAEAKRYGREQQAREALGRNGNFCNSHLHVIKR